ncbi:DNA-binding IclR family transcriptional regulator [Thermocatellispora tengchongensis]|uniref:DNA-binding IclR family transcriptional regulator n=1 Tax=Thermocatellispora tengchongensis TaxID=1073253 RepID=A0A840PKC6_9ACTN|nr:IclR family transcriptional regulator [Thermocatellispora tengchongensis]MBB5136505.1 DNA-binding IclR family transcriptional regulator [Thermocatellispora tengchongensis]
MSVAGRVAGVLEAFLPGDVRLTLTEICRRAGIPLTTGHRLVGELTAAGFLERLPDGPYRIGTRLWRIGAQAAGPRGLRELALPYMAELYAATRENVQLGVLLGDRVLCLERLRGPHSVPVVSRVAGELPLHSTGVGKVLLAYAPEALTERLLAAPLPAYTPGTITDPARLRAELAEIRRTGMAHTQEEMTIGACSAAAPVRGPGEEVVAALSVVAWRHSADLRRLDPAVLEAARGLSRDLADLD